MQQKKIEKTKIFAKIFDHETYGQVLAKKDRLVDGCPTIVVTVDTIMGLAEATMGFKNNIIGVADRNASFDELSIDGLDEMLVSLHDQIAAEMTKNPVGGVQ